MLTSRFEVDLLAKAANQVARLVPGAQVFTRLARALAVPVGWAALILREGRDPLFVPGGETCEQSGARDVLLVRTTPIACSADEAQLHSADGHICCGTIRLSVRILSEATELSSFRNTLLSSSDSLDVAAVNRYLHWQMRKVLAELAARHPVCDLLKPLATEEVRGIVQEKLGAACLAAGLAIDGSIIVHFDAPAYVEQCRREAEVEQQRRRAEMRAEIQKALTATQNERVAHLLELIGKIRHAAGEGSGAKLADLLSTFTEGERAQMYGAVWGLASTRPPTRFIVIASGRELLLFDPNDVRRPARKIHVPDRLGPLRSVTCDANARQTGVLLAGAASGVHVIDIETGAVVSTLRAELDDARSVRGGINKAAMSEDHVFATHSELGLLMWPRIAAGEAAGVALRPDLTAGATTIRCASVAEGRLWWAADHTLWSLPLDDTAQAPREFRAGRATLSAATVAGGMAYTGDVEGQVLAWDICDPESPRVMRSATSSPVESLEVLDDGGLERLIIADRSTALSAIVIGDSYVCRYESAPRIVRRAAVAPDVFAGMNDARDQLMVWNPRNPGPPATSVIIPHLTGGTIQDLCLIPS